MSVNPSLYFPRSKTVGGGKRGSYLISAPPMASTDQNGRAVGTTEHSWCRAVMGGTGITVMAVHLSSPILVTDIEKAIHQLQLSNPILRTKIVDPSAGKTKFCFFFSTSPVPYVKVQSFDASSTNDVLANISDRSTSDVNAIVEHEMNLNPWKDHDFSTPADVLFASLYEVSDGSVLAIRVHPAVADRTSGGAIVNGVVEALMVDGDRKEKEEDVVGFGDTTTLLSSFEDSVPAELMKKAFWARGIGMVGYSMNFLRSSILPFNDAKANRMTRFVKLDLDVDETQKLFSACKERGIKLCGALTASALIAVLKSKNLPKKKSETHTVVTLVDCRNRLEKPLSNRDIGFYHSAIQNLYTVNGEEHFWDLSSKCYTTFSTARDNNKDLQDMADLNILMTKALDNPGMTHSGSMRTALVSVFDEPYAHDSSKLKGWTGTVDDFVFCASSHGIGTSICVYDVVKDGRLSCFCMYPYPLHTREQVQGIVDGMRKILVGATEDV